MFRFEHPEFLYALVVLPLILVLYFYRQNWRKKARKRFGEINLVDKLIPNISKTKPVSKLILSLTGLFFIIIACANPQIGTRLEEVKREGVDIIIALDVSNSMKAQDIRPSRLERSKQAISRLIDQLQNDRIGMIVFAGQAYVQLPITSDYAAAKLFLGSIDTDIIPTQGTCIGCAIDLAVESYVGNDNKHKALIIITDGENHEEDAVESAKKAHAEGVIIHTIGMGSPEGAPIPVIRNGQSDFLKDNEGNTVITKLETLTLERIAAEGKGQFIQASNGDDGLSSVLASINKMQKKSFGTKQFTDYEDRFQYFLAAGLLLLLIEFTITNKRSKIIQNMDLFHEKRVK
ncbi:MAG: VWA domain-containing protein [Bacteroidetes bacterium]|nr:VWA domain-containing protein [Bacteroidota bacterium]